MGLNADRIKAMQFDCPELIPVSVYFLPAAWRKYRQALDEIIDRHPAVFDANPHNPDYDAVSGTYVQGNHVDVWGCVWSNIHEGNEAIVTTHPVPTRESVHSLQTPSQDAGFPHGFMYLRLADLRGFEELMIDFAEEPPELQMLLDTVLAYNLRQGKLMLERRKGREGEMIYFGDDLGNQTALPISPARWRKYLKPCFQQIYKPFIDAGHMIYMHTDGHIHEIIPDLVDVGVKVVNPQSRANGLDNLARVCKGKVCIDLDLDRQLFPLATPAEIDAHVRESVEKCGSRHGGLWLKAELNYEVPIENIEAVCVALEKYRAYYA
jgi:uroporphyrinogen decarboxylase